MSMYQASVIMLALIYTIPVLAATAATVALLKLFGVI